MIYEQERAREKIIKKYAFTIAACEAIVNLCEIRILLAKATQKKVKKVSETDFIAIFVAFIHTQIKSVYG